MLELTIIALFAIIGIASTLALVDCWIRGRYIFERIQEEQSLLDAGFVPVSPVAEVRQRQAVRFDALATPSRLPKQRAHNRASRIQPPMPAPGVA